ncbi:MAG: hypothetical protein M1813_007349 [Trichoglossum hirsutum]|jgi:hypothetical protein|nr:MAG: hypothetical protein M1813_007349 [Trichoglossum hirsutum]
MYPEPKQRSLGISFGSGGAGDEGRERRRSSVFSAFNFGESDGGGRRSSAVWKQATEFLTRRRSQTAETGEEVAVEE